MAKTIAPVRVRSTSKTIPLSPVLQSLHTHLASLRDPYLTDSLREFLRLAAQIGKRDAGCDPAQVVRDAFYVCEVTRDSTMRFLPYASEHEFVLKAAIHAYANVIASLRAFKLPRDAADKVQMYTNHIETRISEYREALQKMTEAVKA